MKNNQIIIGVVIIIVAAGAFFAGMKYDQSQRMNSTPQFSGRNGFSRNSRFANGETPYRGQIISSDNNGITIKLQDGSSKIVIVPDSVQVEKTITGSKTDLSNGANVLILGTTNSDGSITAANVQLNPQFRGFGGNANISPTP